MSDISDELGVTRRQRHRASECSRRRRARQGHASLERPAGNHYRVNREGAETVGNTYNDHRTGVTELFASLSEDKQQRLIRVLGTLREALRQEGISC